MCFVVSVARDSAENYDCIGKIHVYAIVETILYRSAERKVYISCDIIVRNDAVDPVDVVLTHPDDVEGRLATSDWFPEPNREVDERMDLVRRIYGKYWEVVAKDCSIRFLNPTRSPVGTHDPAKRIEARALGFSKVPGPSDFIHVNPRHVIPQDECFGTCRLRPYPEVPPPPSVESRPFSSFCLSLPAKSWVFARVSVFVERETYHRLIESGTPLGGARFAVIGPTRIIEQLKQDLKIAQPNNPFRDFLDNIEKHQVIPERYQIIIGQADVDRTSNQLVRVRPTSSVIRELCIPDYETRDRAMWFDAISTDFRIDLEYEERKHGQKRTRQWFYKRLSPVLANLTEAEQVSGAEKSS